MSEAILRYMALLWYQQLWFLAQVLFVITWTGFVVRNTFSSIYTSKARAAEGFLRAKGAVQHGQEKEKFTNGETSYTSPEHYEQR